MKNFTTEFTDWMSNKDFQRKDAKTRRPSLCLRIFFLQLLCLSGCNLGPYSSPEEIHVDSYTSSTLPLETEKTETLYGESQMLLYGVESPEAWWELFQSEKLNATVDRVLAVNPTIASAEAALRQAWENYRAQTGALLMPQVDLKGFAENYRFADFRAHGTTPFAFPDSFKLYNLSVSASYHLDLFGGSRRQVEAFAAKVDYDFYQLLGVRLTLAANVVAAAFQNALLQAQQEIILREIEIQASKLAIMEGQKGLGSVSELTLIVQRKKLEQAKVLLPQYEKDFQQNVHRLATYLGELPGCSQVPYFDLEEFYLPQELPLSLPSTLVHRRPDILAAEATLHEAMANIGVATANLFPQINLSAGFGPLSVDAQPLINIQAWLCALGASLVQPLFHGGELISKREAAIAAYEAAAADYYQTLLEAFQDVADALSTLISDAKALQSSASIEFQTKKALDLSLEQWALGSLSRLNVLDKESDHNQALFDLVQAQIARLIDTAGLFYALGNGYYSQNVGCQ